MKERRSHAASGRNARTALADPARPGSGLASAFRRLRTGGGEVPVEIEPAPLDLPRRLEQALRRLHLVFNERERQLEAKLQELHRRQQAILAARRRRLLWAVPLGLGGVMAVGYMLYVLTSMQQSMTAMTAEVTAMNGHVGNLAGDAQGMAQDMATMNQTMGYLSGNVAQMNRSVAPMGQMAQTMSPFMQPFRFFMPF